MGHQMALWLLVATVVSSSFSLQAAERDIFRLQGLWRNKAAWDNPGAVFSDPLTLVPHMTLQIVGEEVGVHMPMPGLGTPQARAPFRLATGVTPKQFEISGQFRGIYEIAGDTLRVCFTRDGKVTPARFKTDRNAGTILIEYERLTLEYVRLLAEFQGEWTIESPQALAGSTVSVKGECIYEEAEVMFRLLTFRLNPGKQDPDLQLRSIFPRRPDVQGNYSLANGRPEMRFPLKKGASNPLVPNFRPRGKGHEWLILRRNPPKNSASSEALKERKFPLAERKAYLQQTVAQFGGTKAADRAAEELARMPSDEAIREIDAEFALTTSEHAPPSQKKPSLQAIISQYGETKAAVEARQMLAKMPSAVEIREAEAKMLLDSAKELMKRKPAAEAQHLLD
jgi:uncharacterized protein (TIGR03067 family)